MSKKALIAKIGSLALCAAMVTSFVPAFAAQIDASGFDFQAQEAYAEFDYELEDLTDVDSNLIICPTPTPKPEVENPVLSSASTLFINTIRVSQKPFYKKSTLMLPLRVLVENAGGKYNYNSGLVDINLNGVYHVLEIGKNAYRIGGVSQKLDFAPVIVNSATYVPWQYVERALGMKVTIKDDGRVNVSTKKIVTPPVVNSKMSLVINGKTSAYAPYYSNKVLMIPLRSTVMALGYTYSTSSATKSSTFSAKKINTTIFWNKNSYPVDNKLVKLEKAPELKNGVLYVPASYATKALKCKAVFSANNTKLTLTR